MILRHPVPRMHISLWNVFVQILSHLTVKCAQIISLRYFPFSKKSDGQHSWVVLFLCIDFLWGGYD